MVPNPDCKAPPIDLFGIAPVWTTMMVTTVTPTLPPPLNLSNTDYNGSGTAAVVKSSRWTTLVPLVSSTAPVKPPRCGVCTKLSPSMEQNDTASAGSAVPSVIDNKPYLMDTKTFWRTTSICTTKKLRLRNCLYITADHPAKKHAPTYDIATGSRNHLVTQLPAFGNCNGIDSCPCEPKCHFSNKKKLQLLHFLSTALILNMILELDYRSNHFLGMKPKSCLERKVSF